MLARVDDLPQRHRPVPLHASAPDVDFRTSMPCERIPGRHDPCSRNFPPHVCHARPAAIGISLAEIAGIPRSRQRPPRAGPRDWPDACGNCGNLCHGQPARNRDKCEARAERAERSKTPPGPTAVRGRGEAPGVIRKFPIFSMRESRKPRPPVLTYSGLLRPKVLIVMRKSVSSSRSSSKSCSSFTRHTSETVNLTGWVPVTSGADKGGKRNTRRPPPGRARCGGGRDGVPDAPLIRGPRGPYLPVVPL